MNTLAAHLHHAAIHPVHVQVDRKIEGRDRVTNFFRILLAIPHLLLVGAPMAAFLSWTWTSDNGFTMETAAGGALGVVAGLCALIAWFSLLFTGEYPEGLRKLASFYLRWRVRAVAYMAMLRDEYPPFGDGTYPAAVEVMESPGERDRLSIAFRIILAIPHIVAVWFLGIAWLVTSIIAWFAILFTGRYPEGLYDFGVGVLRWNTRVEAYLLLLHDEFPPFSLH